MNLVKREQIHDIILNFIAYYRLTVILYPLTPEHKQILSHDLLLIEQKKPRTKNPRLSIRIVVIQPVSLAYASVPAAVIVAAPPKVQRQMQGVHNGTTIRLPLIQCQGLSPRSS